MFLPMNSLLSHQAIIAREVIELYNEAVDKQSTAESLDSICFAMARLSEEAHISHRHINWDELEALFDSIAHSGPTPSNEQELAKIYQKVLWVLSG